MIGNAWKHGLAGIFFVFACYVVMMIAGIRGYWLAPPIVNCVLMVAVEICQYDAEYTRRRVWHSLLDWLFGCAGGLLAYAARVIVMRWI